MGHKERGADIGAVVELCHQAVVRNEVQAHPNIVCKTSHVEDAGQQLEVLDVEYTSYGFDPEFLLSNFHRYPQGAFRVVEPADSEGDSQPSLFDQNGDPIDIDRTPKVENTNRPSNGDEPDGLPITPQ
jgi:hypothetical protein